MVVNEHITQLRGRYLCNEASCPNKTEWCLVLADSGEPGQKVKALGLSNAHFEAWGAAMVSVIQDLCAINTDQ